MPDHLVDAARDPAVAVADPEWSAGAAPVSDVPNGSGGRPERWMHRSRNRRRPRVSRWDRPAPPKDWRFVVGTLGKVLIAAGLLLFGFVGYQLWGTGIETARAQNRLESTFEDHVAAATVDDAEATDADVGDDTPDDGASLGPGIGAPSPVVPDAVDVSAGAVDQDVPIAEGEAFAKLDIERIGIHDLYVVPGVQVDDLKKGPGHYPDTPLPGQLGNAALAGHRTTYGAPFFDLDQLVRGDEIVVTMVTGDRFVYRVTGSEIVTAADSWVISTRDPDVAELTLTTCDPKWTARNRLVVHSVLVPEASSQIGLAEIYGRNDADDDVDDVGDEEATASPRADDPVVTTPVVDDASAGAPATDDGTAPDEIDAFSHGWFEDRAAFVQIALWAAALTAITVIGYQIAKRTRHSSIGILVGVVPFVVALYFVYQNVNRLLPPGL